MQKAVHFVLFLFLDRSYTASKHVSLSYQPRNSNRDEIFPEPDDHFCLRSQLWGIGPFREANKLVTKVLSGKNANEANLDCPFRRLDERNSLPALPPAILAMPSSSGLCFRLDLAYLGTEFCGWQRQQAGHHLKSVQEEVEECLQEIVNLGKVDVRVSGRTDRGVHAIGQVARFRIPYSRLQDTSKVKLMDLVELKRGIDHYCRSNSSYWSCRRISLVSYQFHPTFQATSRSYVYMIDRKPLETFLYRNNYGQLENFVQRMNIMLRELVDHDIPLDFFALSAGKLSNSDDTYCKMLHARVVTMDNFVRFEFQSNRFLRRMIRILVSTVLVLAMQRNDGVPSILPLLSSRNRQRSAKAAPPEGLIFVGSSYGRDESFYYSKR